MNVQENLAKMKLAGVDFPLVCKPTMAHGSTRYYEADNFYHLLTNLVLNKIHLKESGIVEEPYKPKLIDHLSTPVLNMEESDEKSTDAFHFWKDLKPKAMNPHATGCVHPMKQTLSVSDPPEAMQCIVDKHLQEVQSEMLLFQKQNDVQEDSGVETSDSCDEKKNKICHRTIKHQHSKKYASNCTSLKEMR
ncbi:hypothetical protein AVEN_119904-1 [Araneus ventricosus]|uniref:Uncharacterized protein n=1 Tax=Araneus ventricosus TaxID=182803 RepID=A0A4Y2JA73_ARAVE|nr:hypothetical protein AVEN_119904-1 [Araneus ventricosus]